MQINTIFIPKFYKWKEVIVDGICYGLLLAEKEEYLFQNYLAWPVLSDEIRDYFSQIELCVGIIISQNV